MAPRRNADDGPQTSVEDLLKAFISALQGLQPRTPSDAIERGGYGNKPQPGPSRSTSPSAEKDLADDAPQKQKVLKDVAPWMQRLFRSDGAGGWITQGDYAIQHSQDQGQSPAVQDETTIIQPALLLELHMMTKLIEIRSKYLIKAINSVNKHPSLQKQPETSIELCEPFPLLYYHLEDIRREISQLNLPEADADFKALECAAQEVAPRWKAAREMSSESQLTRYDTMWTLFHAGDLVVFKDVLGDEWALTLIDVLENCNREENQRTGQFIEKRHIRIRAWGLVWNAKEQKLERKVAEFRIDYFSGAKAMHLLPVYPLRCRQRSELSEAEFLKALAERGRKCFKLATRVSHLEYDGPALDCGERRINDIRLDARKEGFEKAEVSHTEYPISGNYVVCSFLTHVYRSFKGPE
jgi:hypothetical protein